MSYCITLIHGTFAKDAPWTLENSAFCNQLRLHLGDDILINEFNWSGKNSHQSRISASLALAEKLKQQTIDHPNDRKIIFAHSHGGNIAMYALREIDIANEKFELITMATPFLHPKKGKLIDNLEPYLKLIPISALAIPGLFWILVLMIFIVVLYQDKHLYIYVVSLTGIFIVLGNYLFVPYFKKYLKRKFDLLPDIIDNLVEKISVEKLKNDLSMLIVIDRWDEIKLFFAGLSSIWRVIHALHIALVIFARNSNKLFLLCLFLSAILSKINFNLPVDWLLYFCGILLFFWMLFPGISLLFSFSLYFFRSNIFVLGRESIYEQLFIPIKTSIKPGDFKKSDFIQYNLKRRNLLKHSIYVYEEVIYDICNWIKANKKESVKPD